ncbi:MAG: hypothetical protein HC936_19405 [Leptolyngbyaceae cyanobacterium SU_3_3]|nr:hypothetical protein [Leptolyngbyaceae cyanobacterium SU_3_3]
MNSQIFGQKLPPSIVRFLPVFWILLLGWLVFFHRLGNTGLLDETEPLFVEAARQMTTTGDWVTPYFNGVTRFDKPPLIYWLMAIGFQTIGVNEWAARLPSALSATLLTGFCFYILNVYTTQPRPEADTTPSACEAHQRQPVIPYLGAAICALNLQSFFFGRLGYSDMLLSVLLWRVVVCVLSGIHRRSLSRSNSLLSGVLCSDGSGSVDKGAGGRGVAKCDRAALFALCWHAARRTTRN